jgi:hypothetical protein
VTAPFLREGWRDKLHVMAVISNPQRFRTRYDLYQQFAQHMAASGAVLWTVELAFGERSHAVTEAGNPRHLQLRTTHEYWHKESLINLGVQRLPADWQYLAWIDADVQFTRPDWAEETVHMLQHHPIVQLWTEAHDLTPAYEPLLRHKSFAWSLHHVTPTPTADPYRLAYQSAYDTQTPTPHRWVPWHPGFAWAIRRDAFEHVGGLLDAAILGAADNHMAKALVGDAHYSIHPQVSPGYRQMVLEWAGRAAGLKRDLGYVDGLLVHHWHGQKKARQYWNRWQILVQHQFDPRTDLKRDWQGLWQLVTDTPRQWRLRDALRGYFSQRNEDSLDVDPAEGNL